MRIDWTRTIILAPILGPLSAIESLATGTVSAYVVTDDGGEPISDYGFDPIPWRARMKCWFQNLWERITGRRERYEYTFTETRRP